MVFPADGDAGSCTAADGAGSGGLGGGNVREWQLHGARARPTRVSGEKLRTTDPSEVYEKLMEKVTAAV